MRFPPVDIRHKDDPLSAVDAPVGRHLFEACLVGYLRRHTRVLVTHQLQFLKDVDKVRVVGGSLRWTWNDPLSAVDAHVGRHLFEACLVGYLRRRTRVLVTHQLQFLKDVDQVRVVGGSLRWTWSEDFTQVANRR
ncbi:unnamed protein product [Plutella xylostella]|uniref:(diamondback moth) hypothetical protein n=1 Tax=Plutella xylostella TaxID=51655 RepID=A0A8S4E0H3_PLUXY|nr:unnamed protein product [Plutella xylostella]